VAAAWEDLLYLHPRSKTLTVEESVQTNAECVSVAAVTHGDV
jgi:hypothetical protein